VGDLFHLIQREPKGSLVGFVEKQPGVQMGEKPSDGTSLGLGQAKGEGGVFGL
jgi:hypothetical protein